MMVSPDVSIETSLAVVDFIKRALAKNQQIEIYEYGKTKPSFRTGDDFEKFIDSLKIIPIDEHIKRCQNLHDRAIETNHEDYAIQLKWLQQQMQHGGK